ncbi:MAG: hypothetical protein ACKERG_00455 [Candidatus Hodgkinia cicadicola]
MRKLERMQRVDWLVMAGRILMCQLSRLLQTLILTFASEIFKSWFVCCMVV